MCVVYTRCQVGKCLPKLTWREGVGSKYIQLLTLRHSIRDVQFTFQTVPDLLGLCKENNDTTVSISDLCHIRLGQGRRLSLKSDLTRCHDPYLLSTDLWEHIKASGFINHIELGSFLITPYNSETKYMYSREKWTYTKRYKWKHIAGPRIKPRNPALLVRCSNTDLSMPISTVDIAQTTTFIRVTKYLPSRTHMTNTNSPCQDL